MSYATSDFEFVRVLAKDLEAAAIETFVAKRDIAPGERWDEQLTLALRQSSTMVVILSAASVKSKNVADEFGWALDNGLRVIPVLYLPCERPLRLQLIQYVTFCDRPYADAVADLVSALKQEPIVVRPDEPGWWRRALLALVAVFFGVAAFFLAPGTSDAAGSDSCTFRGHAQAVSIAGKGEVSLLRSDLFVSKGVDRVELRHFTVGWRDETGARRSASPETLVVRNPRSLLPANRQSGGPYSAVYRFGTTVEIELLEGGAPGYVEGAVEVLASDRASAPQVGEISGRQPLDLGGTGRRAILAKRNADLAPTYLAGPFRGVEQLELSAAVGTLSCWETPIDGHALIWQTRLSDVGRLMVGAAGFELEVSGSRPALTRTPTLWRRAMFGTLGLLLGAGIALVVLFRRVR